MNWHKAQKQTYGCAELQPGCLLSRGTNNVR